MQPNGCIIRTLLKKLDTGNFFQLSWYQVTDIIIFVEKLSSVQIIKMGIDAKRA